MLQVKAWLEDGKDVRLGDWKAADVEILNTLQLLTAKPVVYLVWDLLHVCMRFFSYTYFTFGALCHALAVFCSCCSYFLSFSIPRIPLCAYLP